MIDLGIDFLLDEGGDVVFTPDGDIKIVEGAAMVAQDISEELKIIKGRLLWSPESGSVMPLFLNDSEADNSAIIGELERVAIADARVKPESVKAYQTAHGKFRLEFTPLAAIEPEILNFDLNTKEAQ